MQILQRDVAVPGRGQPTGNESYLLALDPLTGKDVWRSLRPSEAVAESREAFSTPLPLVQQPCSLFGGPTFTSEQGRS